VRRLAPRLLSNALEGVVRDTAPATLLARVQGVWTEVAGPGMAAAAAPVSERDGLVTVACESAVWAHELELLGPDLLVRLGTALGSAGPTAAGSARGPAPTAAVRQLRFVVGSAPNHR
jgi:predicted nucleic acid-binding Zn ribbon protein